MTETRSKVRLMSNHDIEHLNPSINTPTIYQVPVLYGSNYRSGKILKVKVTTALSKGQIMVTL